MAGFICIQTKNKTGSYELQYLGAGHTLNNLNGLLNAHGTQVQFCIPLKERVLVSERREFMTETLGSIIPIMFLPVGLSLMGKHVNAWEAENEKKDQSEFDEKLLRSKMGVHLEQLLVELWDFFEEGGRFEGIFSVIRRPKYWKDVLKLKNDREINRAVEICKAKVSEVLRYSRSEKFSDMLVPDHYNLVAIAANIKGEDWKHLIDQFVERKRYRPESPDFGPLQNRKLFVEAVPGIAAVASSIVVVTKVEMGNALEVSIGQRGKELSERMDSKILFEQAI